MPGVIPDVIAQSQRQHQTNCKFEPYFMRIKNTDSQNQKADKKPQAAVNQHFRIKRIQFKRRIYEIQQNDACDKDDTN